MPPSKKGKKLTLLFLTSNPQQTLLKATTETPSLPLSHQLVRANIHLPQHRISFRQNGRIPFRAREESHIPRNGASDHGLADRVRVVEETIIGAKHARFDEVEAGVSLGPNRGGGGTHQSDRSPVDHRIVPRSICTRLRYGTNLCSNVRAVLRRRGGQDARSKSPHSCRAKRVGSSAATTAAAVGD